MFDFLPTIILRHRKENLKKCSLQGLESRTDIQFLAYPCADYPNLSSYVVLSLDAPPLAIGDADSGLLLIDGTWKYAEVMARQLPYCKPRSLPKEIRTAYPRKQTDCIDPKRGLASVEALYIAYMIMGRDPSGLLDHYYWEKSFHQNNTKFHQSYGTQISHEASPSGLAGYKTP